MNLDEYMSMCAKAPFEWGKFDCCTFSAGAVAITTGKDLTKELGPYIDPTTCAINMRAAYGTHIIRDMFLQVVEKHGARKIDLSDAQNGDVVCIEWPKQFLGKGEIDQSCGLGVFYNNSAYGCAHGGIIQIPLTHRIIDIWRF